MHRDRGAETRRGGPDEDRRERDLGHEEDGAAPVARGPRSTSAEVDLGLAAAGDAVEQEGGEARLRRSPRGAAAAPGPAPRTAPGDRALRRAGSRGRARRAPPGSRWRRRFRGASGPRAARNGRGRARPPGSGPAGLGAGEPAPRPGRRPGARPSSREARPTDQAKALGAQVLLHRRRGPAGAAGPDGTSGPSSRRRARVESGNGPLRSASTTASAGRRAAVHQARHRTAGPHAGGRKDEPEALPRRREVVVGHPFGEVEERRRATSGRLVDDLEDVLERRPGLDRGAVPSTTPITRRGPKGTTTRAPRSGTGSLSGTR